MRKACIEQLSIILTGDRLREVAAELHRQETRPDLRKRLERLARDVDWEGSEAEKNRALAPLDKIPEDDSNVEFPAPIEPGKDTVTQTTKGQGASLQGGKEATPESPAKPAVKSNLNSEKPFDQYESLGFSEEEFDEEFD